MKLEITKSTVEAIKVTIQLKDYLITKISEFLNFDHNKIKSISVLKLSSESVIDGEVKESKITGYYLTIQ